VHAKAPIIYYPASPGLKSWFLTWPTVSAEWRRGTGVRLWTGVGMVATNGGMAGTVREVGDSFVTVEIADNVRVRLQKGAIANVLPKGTLKSA
jgi:hypothetical protein